MNIVDADVAVLTSVDIDHIDYLGPTREDIGREKAGIFRAGRPAICADPDPPDSVLAAATRLGRHAAPASAATSASSNERHAVALPGAARRALRPAVPALRGAYQLANAAAALAALDRIARSRCP